MAPIGGASQFDQAALTRRQALQGASGPAALVKNIRVFGIACFACLGGLLYGYNQGVFSGVLTMTSFGDRECRIHDYTYHCELTVSDMGVWTEDQTKKGWLTAILELGAWVGTLYSGFLAEILSRKYAILINTAVFIIGVIIQCVASSGPGHSAILGGRFIT